MRGALLLIHSSKRERRECLAVTNAVVSAPRDQAGQRASSTIHKRVVFNPTPWDKHTPGGGTVHGYCQLSGRKAPCGAGHEHGIARYPHSAPLGVTVGELTVVELLSLCGLYLLEKAGSRQGVEKPAGEEPSGRRFLE